MLKKMPWLSSRRRLLILSIVDYLIIISLFLIMQSINFINTNLLAVNILAICWIITSYILDKYSKLDDYIDNDFISKFSRTFKTYIISGILFKIIIIVFAFLNSNVGDGKWIIFLAIVSSISFLYEIGHLFYSINIYQMVSIGFQFIQDLEKDL